MRLFDRRVGASMDLAWSPDGQRIASGHANGGVCIWTAATNHCDGFIHAHRSATFSIAWSTDGAQLATAGGIIRIWSTRTGQLMRAFGEDSGYIYDRIEWPQPGLMISLETGIQGQDENILRIWDVQSGTIQAEFRGQARSE